MSEGTVARRSRRSESTTETLTSADVGTVETTASAGPVVMFAGFDLEMPEAPARKGGVGKPSVYPLKELEVGKCILVPLAQLKQIKSAAVAAQRSFDEITSETKQRKGKDGEMKTVPVRKHTRTFKVLELTELQFSKLPKEVKAKLDGGAVGCWRTA